MQASTKLFRLAALNALLFMALTAVFLLSSCGGSGGSGASSEHFASRPLATFQIDSSAVASGTGIQIVGFSGGNRNAGDTLNYCQFIGINEATEDTVRILAAYINVDQPESGDNTMPVFTSPLLFDGHKGVREATFKIPDEKDKMMIKLAPELEKAGNNPDFQKIGRAATDSTVKKEYVIVHDDIHLFAAPRKTVVGLLIFKQQPW